MDYQIEHGPVFTSLRVVLNKGESIKSEAGAMVSMSPSIKLEAQKAAKGLFGSLKAAVGGESFFASLYTAEEMGEVVLAPSALGDIMKIDLSGNTIYAQNGAYLAGTPDLVLSSEGSLKAMVSGEGMFLQKITGNGVLFLNSYGSIYHKELQQGETYIVDTGHIVAFEESVKYKLKKAAKGMLSSMATGEGLVCEYSGPGKIWMQTRNLPGLAELIKPFIPKG